MATQDGLFDLPMVASSNVSAIVYGGVPAAYSSGGIPQFSVVQIDTATGNPRDVKLVTANTVMHIGVVQNSGNGVLPGANGNGGVGPGDSCQVRFLGVSKCVAGAAITAGSQVMANASGQVVTATAPAATNIYLVGIALTAAAAAGDLVEVLLYPGSTQQINV